MTGAERPPSRDRFRTSTNRPPSAQGHHEPLQENLVEKQNRRKELDDAQAEVKTLRYTIDNNKQEEALTKLRHESELRDVRRKAEEDFQKMQKAEAEKSKAVRQFEALLKEFEEAKSAANNEKTMLERKLRDSEESKRFFEEEIEEIRTEKDESIRSLDRKSAELITRCEALQKSVTELQQDSDSREALLQETQENLAISQASIGDLEGEILRLKSQVGDVDVAKKIKQEMHEQLTHVRKLEEINKSQAAEVKHLQQLHKATEVVEEEKRSLQRKLDAMQALEHELGEARIQRQRLEDERLAWTAYLRSQGGGEGHLDFESPEALARAYVEEQIRIATLTERVGAVEADATEKDGMIELLESERSTLKQELEKDKEKERAAPEVPAIEAASSTTSSTAKLVQRLERQKTLANKEIQYLRDQLKVYDTEDTTFQADQLDEAKQKRIEELENVVEQYRTEVQHLTNELTTAQAAQPASSQSETIPHGTKRPHSSTSPPEESEQMGQLLRKNRKLQDEYSILKASNKLLEKELSVTKERLTAASKERQTRVLSLRSNPTSDFEAIKLSTLKTLRQENEDLLAQIKNHYKSAATSTIPLSTLHAAEAKITELTNLLKSQTTRNDRLLKTWSAKTSEFRQSIIDLLGWDVQFLKDGKLKVTSAYYPATEDAENSIMFDGVRGSMKVSGGPESKFAGKIGDNVKYWVRGKGCVPGLLAALTLEFWEEQAKDHTMSL